MPLLHPSTASSKEGNMLDGYNSTIPITVSLLSLNASFEKRNNLDEFINIPTKAKDARSEHMTGTIRSPRQKMQLFSKSTNPLDLSQKSAIRALFRAKSVDPEAYSPRSFRILPKRRCKDN